MSGLEPGDMVDVWAVFIIKNDSFPEPSTTWQMRVFCHLCHSSTSSGISVISSGCYLDLLKMRMRNKERCPRARARASLYLSTSTRHWYEDFKDQHNNALYSWTTSHID